MKFAILAGGKGIWMILLIKDKPKPFFLGDGSLECTPERGQINRLISSKKIEYGLQILWLILGKLEELRQSNLMIIGLISKI